MEQINSQLLTLLLSFRGLKNLVLNVWTKTFNARLFYKNCNIDDYYNIFKYLQGSDSIKLVKRIFFINKEHLRFQLFRKKDFYVDAII